MTAGRYRIVVRGEVDGATLDRLGEIEARPGQGRTALLCDIVDQSHLVGLLSGLSRVGFEVISAAPVGASAL